MGCRERTRGALAIPGSRPSGIYNAGVAQSYINLYNTMVGKEVIIMGSGDIGMIMARRLTLEGAKVKAVFEVLPYPSGLPRNIEQCLNDYGIPLYLSHSVVKIKGEKRIEGVTVVQVDEKMRPIPGTEEDFSCDTLVLSVGLIPENELSLAAGVLLDGRTKGAYVDENYQTSVPGVYAIGDCVFGHAQLAHTASAMGEVAAENICGHEAHYCEKTNPTCVYMEPEAASVGLTEEQCKAQGIAYKVGKFPMSANGKALILNGGEGLVKIIAGAEYGEILGMHIIGPRATDLIAEGALAIGGEMTLDELIDTIHSHPTVTETMREAALNAEKRAIHTKN